MSIGSRADWVDDRSVNDWYGAGHLHRRARSAGGQDDVRLERYELLSIPAKAIGVLRRPAIGQVQVLASEHCRDRSGRLQQRCKGRAGTGHNDVWRERDQFR